MNIIQTLLNLAQNEIAEGITARPSTGIVSTFPLRQRQTTELVVPKSIPIGYAIAMPDIFKGIISSRCSCFL